MKMILYILLLLPFASNGQMIINSFQFAAPPAGGPPTTNLWAYYEADAGVTGSPVSQWNDLSGNGRHLTQATAGDRPTISSNIITFNYTSTSPFLSRAATPGTPYTVYMVVSMATPSTYTIPYCDCSGGNIKHTMFSDGSQLRLSQNNGTNQVSTSLPSANTYTLIRSTFNGASSALQKNNTTAGTGSAGTTAANTVFMVGNDIGTGFAGTFSIKAVYIYTESTDNAALKTYTTTKWGLP